MEDKWFCGETMHTPVVAIRQNPLNNDPKRLQMLLLRLSQYDVIFKYIPGSQMYLADTLVRAHGSSTGISDTERAVELIPLIDGVLISNTTVQRLQEAIHNDAKMQILLEYISNG